MILKLFTNQYILKQILIVAVAVQPMKLLIPVTVQILLGQTYNFKGVHFKTRQVNIQ